MVLLPCVGVASGGGGGLFCLILLGTESRVGVRGGMRGTISFTNHELCVQSAFKRSTTLADVHGCEHASLIHALKETRAGFIHEKSGVNRKTRPRL